MSIKSYRDLEVWQRGIDLVEEVYKVSKLFPRDEQLGLTNQIRRSSVSVPANIAEGQARSSRADFLRFLHIAKGSLAETETHLLISLRLTYVSREQVKPTWALSQEVGRLLSGLIRSLEKDRPVSGNGRISELTELYEISDE